MERSNKNSKAWKHATLTEQSSKNLKSKHYQGRLNPKATKATALAPKKLRASKLQIFGPNSPKFSSNKRKMNRYTSEEAKLHRNEINSSKIKQETQVEIKRKAPRDSKPKR